VPYESGCHRNSGLPEFRKFKIAVSRVDPTYGDKRGHDESNRPRYSAGCVTAPARRRRASSAIQRLTT
jgi:hypothetical protein